MNLILAYHGVDDLIPEGARWVVYGDRRYDLRRIRVVPSCFRQQMEHLHRNGFRSVGLDTVLERLRDGGMLHPREFCLTFDDGYRDALTVAYPVLKQFGFFATIFLVTDKVSESRLNGQFLSWEDVRFLQAEGFGIGAHTCSHPLLTTLSEHDARREIVVSKTTIETQLGSSVPFFCYPYGDFNPAVENLVRAAGFRGAVVTPHGPGLQNGIYAMKRVGINRDNRMCTFRMKVYGFFDWVRERSIVWKVAMGVRDILRWPRGGAR